MLGGTDWRLTSFYCQEMNDLVRRRLGESHSAKMLVYNPDAAELVALQGKGQWREIGHLLTEAAKRLVGAGADFLMICNQALHIVAEQLNAAVPAPFLHMGEAIGERLCQDGIHCAWMLGTAFAVEQALLRQRLADSFSIDLLLPDAAVTLAIHDLSGRGETGLTLESKGRLVAIFDGFRTQGAEALLLDGRRIDRPTWQSAWPLPIYDTVSLHAEAAARWLLA